MEKLGYAAIIFEYDDDGNFLRGNWQHRLIAIHVAGHRTPVRLRAFGNILFYRTNDVHLLETLITVLRSLS
jgi:hypothetical protein